MPRPKIILPGSQYLVSIFKRPERHWPWHLKILDRKTGHVWREVIRGLTIRQKKRAYRRAVERQDELNSGRPTIRLVPWAEARRDADALVRAETRPATAREYLWAVARLERFLVARFRNGKDLAAVKDEGERRAIVQDAIVSPERITAKEARTYLAWRTTGGADHTTANKDLRSLKAYWARLKALEAVTLNPWHDVPELEEFARLKIRLTRPQLAALMAESGKHGTDFQTCLALQVDTAMRARELSHLTWQHVDLDGGCVHVTREPCGWEPKDHEEGKLYIDVEVVLGLRDLQGRRITALVKAGLDGDEARKILKSSRVFGVGQSPGADPWERTYNATLKKACKAAGVPDIRSHAIRRTTARVARESGAEGRDIQRMLRHSSFQTTQEYIGDDQADASARAHEALRRGLVAKPLPQAKGDAPADGGQPGLKDG